MNMPMRSVPHVPLRAVMHNRTPWDCCCLHAMQYIFNHVKDKLDHLPDTCPLKPGLDIFAAHEAHKAKKNKAHHKCTYCNKVCACVCAHSVWLFGMVSMSVRGAC